MKNFMTWIYSIEPAWFRDNGWVNESFAGFVGGALFMWISGGSIITTLIGFNLISVVYELFVDPHGWSIKDVLMRLPALAVTTIALTIWR